MQDVIVYMASIDDEHLSRHTLVALPPAFAMAEEAFADLLDSHLARIGPIDTRL